MKSYCNQNATIFHIHLILSLGSAPLYKVLIRVLAITMIKIMRIKQNSSVTLKTSSIHFNMCFHVTQPTLSDRYRRNKTILCSVSDQQINQVINQCKKRYESNLPSQFSTENYFQYWIVCHCINQEGMGHSNIWELGMGQTVLFCSHHSIRCI